MPELRAARRPPCAQMFMQKEEWSEDDLEDMDETVVPLPVPTPQVLSGGSGAGGSDNGYRASAYNERMQRARNAARKTPSQGASQGARGTFPSAS